LNVERIPVSGPSITQKEIDYVTDAVTHAWYANANVYHERFERAFAEYLGVPFAMALPSCTSAIHLSLLALGIGPGDEVIVPDITWIASAAPITYVGATAIFADIDARTWCLSAPAFEACISSKTKAVIPVDLYGNLPSMDAIQEIATANRIAVVEDAAEAVGSEYRGQRAGSFGDTSTFSFHGSKTLTTGEGGMLVTGRDDLYRRAQFLRDHGRKPGDKAFFNSEIGYKYKMSSLQAALGLAQLERIADLVIQKRQIFAWYQQQLGDLDGITLNYEAPETKNTYWMVTAVVDPKFDIGKERLQAEMNAYNIDCRPFFYPLSSLPAFASHADTERARRANRVSYQISPFAINLPSGLNMTEERVEYVCNALKRVLQRSIAMSSTSLTSGVERNS
jgi:perosamine synthetase